MQFNIVLKRGPRGPSSGGHNQHDTPTSANKQLSFRDEIKFNNDTQWETTVHHSEGNIGSQRWEATLVGNAGRQRCLWISCASKPTRSHFRIRFRGNNWFAQCSARFQGQFPCQNHGHIMLSRFRRRRRRPSRWWDFHEGCPRATSQVYPSGVSPWGIPLRVPLEIPHGHSPGGFPWRSLLGIHHG